MDNATPTTPAEIAGSFEATVALVANTRRRELWREAFAAGDAIESVRMPVTADDVPRVSFDGEPSAVRGRLHAALEDGLTKPAAPAERWPRLIDALEALGVEVGAFHSAAQPAPSKLQYFDCFMQYWRSRTNAGPHLDDVRRTASDVIRGGLLGANLEPYPLRGLFTGSVLGALEDERRATHTVNAADIGSEAKPMRLTKTQRVALEGFETACRARPHLTSQGPRLEHWEYIRENAPELLVGASRNTFDTWRKTVGDALRETGIRSRGPRWNSSGTKSPS